MRQKLGKLIRGDRDFRWRSEEVSRVEGFSDAVFAFAVTLLVVSLEVPRSFADLQQTMGGFVAFGLCFTILVFIWHNHYIFFRRFGIQDLYTITLNGVLLFVVLFYIYPLKFLFTFLINTWSGLGEQVAAGATRVPGQMSALMITYSVGFLTIFFIFLLLYLHAYRHRSELELNDVEIRLTRFSLQAHAIYMGVALLSITVVLVGGERLAWLAGVIYGLIGPARLIHGLVVGPRIDRAAAQTRS